MEQTQCNLLFRWFIGLSMDDSVWVPTVFTKNRERLIAHDAIIELFSLIVETADHQGWLSGEHESGQNQGAFSAKWQHGDLTLKEERHESFCPGLH